MANWTLKNTDPIDYDTSTIGLQWQGNISTSSVNADGIIGNYVVVNNGGNSIFMNTHSTASTILLSCLIKIPVINNATAIIGFGSSYSNAESFLVMNFDGSISFSGYLLGTIGTTAPLNNITTNFNYLQLQYVFSNTNTGSINCYWNGVNVFSKTGIRTFFSDPSIYPPSTFNLFAGNYLSKTAIFDNTAGGVNIIDGGQYTLVTQYPINDFVVAFTPNTGLTNYNLVNSPVPNLGTSYVYTDTALTRDLYGFPNPPANIGDIIGVQMRYVAQHDTGSNRLLEAAYENTATVILGPSIGIAPTNYALYIDNQTKSPFTGNAWTVSEITLSAFGQELQS